MDRKESDAPEFAAVRVGPSAFALVDPTDLAAVSDYRWQVVRAAGGLRYASANVGGRRVLMHRLLTDAPTGLVVDHTNRNGLDNRRCNLRLCTQSQNLGNQPRRQKNTSGYKGVSRNRERWIAAITMDGRDTNLGRYDTPEEAARAYDAAARKYFGEFARLNFPNDGEQAA